ncbi:MAG: hypothetical protein JWN71_4771 [Xanthobacteraceae bacterium]|nr:hypothetical protein [Xanthobacteraceae bacterium]
MAEHSRKIPRSIKLRLIEEAGGKCSNPGCSNTRVQFHHINHWAVYKTHSPKQMIALCPSCHDATHNGVLKITDGILHSWRRPTEKSDFLYATLEVAPNKEVGLLTGSIMLSIVNPELITFQLSNTNTLAFRVEGSEIVLLKSDLIDLSGEQVLQVRDNRVRSRRDEQIEFNKRPGRISITVPSSDRYIYPWMIEHMRQQVHRYATDGRITSLDLEVVEPGLIRVKGAWIAPEGGVVITDDLLSFLKPNLREPISLRGEGRASCLVVTGPVTTALFVL